MRVQGKRCVRTDRQIDRQTDRQKVLIVCNQDKLTGRSEGWTCGPRSHSHMAQRKESARSIDLPSKTERWAATPQGRSSEGMDGAPGFPTFGMWKVSAFAGSHQGFLL